MSEPEWVGLGDGPTVADVAWLNAQENGSPIDERWRPIDLAALAEDPPVQPTLGGMGLAYPGKRHVFSGPQESAKTLVAYLLGIEVLRAKGVFCLLDFEMGRWDARNRLRELGASQDELREVVYFEPEGRMPERVPQTVIQRVQGREAIVIVDAAAGAFAFEELDDNKRLDVERFANVYIEPFRRAGIATLVLDHVVKSTEARGNYAIGSERKVGQTDVHIGFSVVSPIKRGSTGVYKITTHKDRGGFLKRGKLGEIELRSDPDTHHISWSFTAAVEGDEEHPFEPTHLMEKVSRYLELAQNPVNMSAIERDVEGKRDYLRTAVERLVARGFAEESAGPNRQRLIESLEAYREAFSGSPQVRPEFAPEPGSVGSPARPSPYGEGEGDHIAPRGAPSPPQSLLDPTDGIPF